MLKFISLLLKIILITYLVIFSVNNKSVVELDMFFDYMVIEMPLFLFAVIVLLLGVVIGGLSMISYWFKSGRESKKLKKEISKLNTENTKLRNITISSTDSSLNNNVAENESVKNQLR